MLLHCVQPMTLSRTFGGACLTAAFLMVSADASSAEPTVGPVAVSPANLRLVHPRRPHSITVAGRSADGLAVDLTSVATIKSADETVVVVEIGWVRPLKSGATKVIVQAAGQTVEVPVQVELPAAEPAWSFKHDVMPVFTKAGCNMGACHGYSLGKGGFKLSLRGGDAAADYLAIFRDAQGRRLNLVDPASSLLVQKPLGDVPHRGGVRFSRGSALHETLTRWIAQGALGDADDKVDITHVSIFPERFAIEPGTKHRMQLIAHYTDGTTRDVTRDAIFTINTEGVGHVDETGMVTGGEFGESAVVARFERKFAAARIIVRKSAPDFTPTPIPEGHFIDRHVITKLNDLKVKPAGLCTDEEFLRRVSLDLIGLQPMADEVRAFLADTSADKRTRAIDALFQRPEYVDQWSLKWGDLLQNSRVRASSESVYAFREWLRSAVASDMPLDEFTRTLLTARGGAEDNPAAAFFAVSKDPNETTERVAQVFCGVRMLCARCHVHPMENWTQEDYYGLQSFFTQVSAKVDPRLPGIPNARAVLLTPSAGFATNPRTFRAQPPRYLGGSEPTLPADADRRPDFAKWLTTADNPLFARGLVNRYWSYFFHRGIIDPVDDLRTTNPPVNPELLDALTKDFVTHGFRPKHLMRTIVTSETYQRSSVPNDSNRYDTLNFSRAVERRIPAEALLDSLVQATNSRESFGNAPGGFTAAQLPDAEATSEFLSLFGKPQRMEACECERDNESNMLQALHFINGNPILKRVTDPNGRIAQLLVKFPENDALIEELYLWTICRKPTPQDLDLARRHFESFKDKRAEAAQDLAWALLNSRDFLLMH